MNLSQQVACLKCGSTYELETEVHDGADCPNCDGILVPAEEIDFERRNIEELQEQRS